MIGEEESPRPRACHRELEAQSIQVPGGGMWGLLTLSQLLSWNQAPGLLRTVLVLDMAMAVLEFCSSGPNRRKPFAWVQSHLIIWEGLGGACG